VRLIGLLQAGRQKNAESLATECQVSRRTIFRDLDLLRSAGVPLLFDDEQGSYRIPANYYQQPTNFTTEEGLAVLLMCYEFGAENRLPFCEPARTAAIKLESSLAAPLREQLRSMAGSVRMKFVPTSRLTGQEPIYRQLLDAAARRRSVRITYESFSDNDCLSIKLSPYRLLFSRHSWYVIGRSSLHREVRTFNVGRVLTLVPLDETFEVPRSFSINRYLGNAWHLIREPGPDQAVVVRFEKLVARNVAEVQWHTTQRLEWLADGRLDYHVTVSGLNEISWWILGYGDQAEVLSPNRLRRLVAGRAARLAAKYARKPAAARGRRAVAGGAKPEARRRKPAARKPGRRPPG
jgi:predicted DNA-binding transcriptional regulator YafY